MNLFQACKPYERKAACTWDYMKNLTMVPEKNRSQVYEQRVEYLFNYYMAGQIRAF